MLNRTIYPALSAGIVFHILRVISSSL